MNQFLLWNGLLSLMLAMLLGTLAIYIGFNAFKRINPQIDEEFELRNNNIAVAVVVGAITVTLGLMLAGGMERLLQAIVPTPAVFNENLPSN